MRLACEGCCFRIELELFAPMSVFRRYEVLPRRARFGLERRLRRRVARELQRRAGNQREDTE